jgi:hypothetical protein
LGKGRNGTTEDLGYGGGHGGFNFYGNEGALVKIYGEAGGCRDVIESLFEVGDMVRDSTDDDKSVVSIQKDRAR